MGQKMTLVCSVVFQVVLASKKNFVMGAACPNFELPRLVEFFLPPLERFSSFFNTKYYQIKKINSKIVTFVSPGRGAVAQKTGSRPGKSLRGRRRAQKIETLFRLPFNKKESFFGQKF